MNIETLTEFLGWCLLINLGILLFSTIILIVLRNPVSIIHGRMFGLIPEDLPLIYFQYLGNFKIAVIIFNLVPYIVLKVLV